MYRYVACVTIINIDFTLHIQNEAHDVAIDIQNVNNDSDLVYKVYTLYKMYDDMGIQVLLSKYKNPNQQDQGLNSSYISDIVVYHIYNIIVYILPLVFNGDRHLCQQLCINMTVFKVLCTRMTSLHPPVLRLTLCFLTLMRAKSK